MQFPEIFEDAVIVTFFRITDSNLNCRRGFSFASGWLDSLKTLGYSSRDKILVSEKKHCCLCLHAFLILIWIGFRWDSLTARLDLALVRFFSDCFFSENRLTRLTAFFSRSWLGQLCFTWAERKYCTTPDWRKIFLWWYSQLIVKAKLKAPKSLTV